MDKSNEFINEAMNSQIVTGLEIRQLWMLLCQTETMHISIFALVLIEYIGKAVYL